MSLVWAEVRDRLTIRYISSVDPASIQATAFIRDRRGKVKRVHVPVTTSFTSDRTARIIRGDKVEDEGEVIWATIGGTFDGLKPSEFYAWLFLDTSGRPDKNLCIGGIDNGKSGLNIGEFREASDGPGRPVQNEASSTLVNNVSLTRTITVPSNARWMVHGGIVFNADDVARNVTVILDDGAQRLACALAKAIGATENSGWPFGSDAVIQTHEPADSGYPFPLVEGDRIQIAFIAGGASAGGTARSSAVVQEYIQP